MIKIVLFIYLFILFFIFQNHVFCYIELYKNIINTNEDSNEMILHVQLKVYIKLDKKLLRFWIKH